MSSSTIAVERATDRTPEPRASSRWRGGFLSRWHVLEAAMACFEAEGYERVTIRAIAGRLGCSVGSIYRYFEDKQALLRACGGEAMRPAVEAAEDGSVGIEVAVAAYVAAATRRSELYRLAVWLGGERDRLPEAVGRVLAGWTIKLGETRLAEQRWASVHGMICLGAGDRAASVGAPADHAASERSPAPSAERRTVSEMEDVTLL